MVSPEQPYNSFQIIRPVLETEALKRFLTLADELARAAFERNFVLVTSENDKSDLENENTKRALGIPRHEIYNSGHLRLPLVDKRSPRGIKAQAYFRAYNRFLVPESPARLKNSKKHRDISEPLMPYVGLRQAALGHDIPNNQELELNFSGLTLVEDPADRGLGYEIALVPSPLEATTLLLLDEARLCQDALSKFSYSVAFPASKTSPKLSFMRTPRENVSDRNITDFMDDLHDLLPVSIKLGEITPIFNS